MEYKVQTTETRIYTPNETLKSLHNLFMKFDNMASLLIQEYLKELIKLEQNNNEKECDNKDKKGHKKHG